MAARKKKSPSKKSRALAKPRDPTVDHEQRSRHAEKLFAEQMSYGLVADALMRKFKVCLRTAHSDIALAYQRIRETDDAERGHRKAVMRSTWKRQFEICMKAEKLNAANRALIELGRLDGLYDPKKIELSGTVGVAVTQKLIVDVLDEAGLAALDVVLRQLEAAGVPALPSGDDAVAPSLAAVIDAAEVS